MRVTAEQGKRIAKRYTELVKSGSSVYGAGAVLAKEFGVSVQTALFHADSSVRKQLQMRWGARDVKRSKREKTIRAKRARAGRKGAAVRWNGRSKYRTHAKVARKRSSVEQETWMGGSSGRVNVSISVADEPVRSISIIASDPRSMADYVYGLLKREFV